MWARISTPSFFPLLADGRPDSGFGTSGTVTTGLGVDGSVNTVGAVQPDGKILIAGGAYPSWSADNTEFGLARFLPDGRRDRSFGRGGEVLTRFGVSADAYGTAIAIPG